MAWLCVAGIAAVVLMAAFWPQIMEWFAEDGDDDVPEVR